MSEEKDSLAPFMDNELKQCVKDLLAWKVSEHEQADASADENNRKSLCLLLDQVEQALSIDYCTQDDELAQKAARLRQMIHRYVRLTDCLDWTGQALEVLTTAEAEKRRLFETYYEANRQLGANILLVEDREKTLPSSLLQLLHDASASASKAMDHFDQVLKEVIEAKAELLREIRRKNGGGISRNA